ncbi:uncharacterized protein LOC129584363 [Paramacrobiotus metropolitanus]|uniref:uncharacterized protein LOC129584363 n=1 Tax=Paramacrobiotus metropolitanus TaxID=2943436 RepID=UPI0024464DA6|nr:uncharacterized protein LOC129584363 [Paramacrobiotus metropolitanus]
MNPQRRRGNRPPGDDPGGWWKSVGGLVLARAGAVAAGVVLTKWFSGTNRERPVRLFWDIENAQCMIPKYATFEKCVAHLRSIASPHGIDLYEQYSIKIICGGFDGNSRCSQDKCIQAAKVCDNETLKTWKAGGTVSTRLEGVTIQCGWDRKTPYAKDKADNMIFEQLMDVFQSNASDTKVIVVTVDYRLRERVRTAPIDSSKHIVVLHPLNETQDGVWPDEFYKRSS